MAKVIITIPLYNGEKYIRNTINSILNQTFGDFEIVISDDGSKDGSLEILKEYKDSRIKVVHNDNEHGLFQNFNNCFDIMKKSSSKYSLLLCQDDLLREDYLEKKIKIMDNDESIVLVSNATNITNLKMKKLFTRRNVPEGKYNLNQMIKYTLKKGNIFGEPAVVLMRTSVLDKVEGFSTNFSYASDWDLYMDISKFGNVYFMDEVLSDFTISKTSGTARLLKEKKVLFKENEEIIKKIYRLQGIEEKFFNKKIRQFLYFSKFYAKYFIFKFFA